VSRQPDGVARAAIAVAAAALPLCLGIDLLHSRDKAVEEGNAQMKAGKPEQALGRYDEAVKRLPEDPGVHFNRGAALYGLSRWEEAAQSFLQATEAKAPALKGAAFYNLGNAFFQAKKYGEAVEAFKKALAYNPGDQRAKWNLELALRNKKDEDKNKQGDKNKDPKNDQKQDDKKGEQQKADDKDQQAKNEPQKPGDESKGDQQDNKDGEKKSKQDQQADQKDQQKPPEQKPQQAQNDPKQPPEDKGQGKADQQDKQDQKDKPPQASNQPQKGQTGNKGKQPPPDMAEVDAILDNLEKSPKALEQELARVRAMNRRPPAKDW
jgi:tetratricopeptide (TPR) repeat protein